MIILPAVTSSTQFATLGYQGLFSGKNTAASLIDSGFSVSFDAAAKYYVMDVPVSQPGVFESPDSGGNSFLGKLTDLSSPGQSQPLVLNVGRSTSGSNSTTFDYTAWATYQQQISSEEWNAGYMAFGVPTPQSGVPVTGSATYTAEALGYGGGYIDGKATLQFDFGAGSLTGTLDLWDAEWDPGVFPRGHFDLTHTVVGSGVTAGQFSGELSGDMQHGSFNGLLTGPNAQELMARWNATYPNSDNIMYGILVGKKN